MDIIVEDKKGLGDKTSILTCSILCVSPKSPTPLFQQNMVKCFKILYLKASFSFGKQIIFQSSSV